MKEIILLTLLFITSLSFSQEYDTIIQELDRKLESAISNESFEDATQLKKERDLYIQLKESIQNEDFERALQIKKELARETVSVEINDSKTPEDCIIYFFAGETVGPIGGSINSRNFETIKITSNVVVKKQIPAGKITFKTNSILDICSELNRELKAGRIYFIEFGDNFIADPNIKSATLRFVDLATFNLVTHGNFEAPENYKIEDTGIKETPSKLNFSVETKCLNCRLYVNGVQVVKNLKKKVVYSINVPSDELSVTFHAKADNKKFKAVPSFSQNISLAPKDEHFLEIDFNLFAKILHPAKITELTSEEFKLLTEKFESQVLDPFSY